MPRGIEGERPRGELTSQQSKPTEQHKPHQEGGNGSLGLPPTINERAKPPPESQGEPTPAKRKRGRPRLPIPPEDVQRLQKRGRNDRYYQKHRDEKLGQNKHYQKEHREERTQYKRDYRKRPKEQHEAELSQSRQDQYIVATQIFP
jgi:hypothetical protein